MPAHWNPFGPLDVTAPETPATPYQRRRAETEAGLCRAALDRGGVAAGEVSSREVGPGCSLAGTVEARGVGETRVAPVVLACPVALRLAQWERHDLQRLAAAHLASPVVRILHLGGFACRRIRTDSGPGQRMSQHATANAFDIAGFVLADGRRVRLPEDWGSGTREGRFLEAVQTSLCRRFNTVLGPRFNRAHANHFHVDLGPWRSCR
ncbi:MAG: extensin family protein [Pseudomonadota bacterium]